MLLVAVVGRATAVFSPNTRKHSNLVFGENTAKVPHFSRKDPRVFYTLKHENNHSHMSQNEEPSTRKITHSHTNKTSDVRQVITPCVKKACALPMFEAESDTAS